MDFSSVCKLRDLCFVLKSDLLFQNYDSKLGTKYLKKCRFMNFETLRSQKIDFFQNETKNKKKNETVRLQKVFALCPKKI